jgi:geranylgeranyl pyrophosphate synthase
MDHENILKKEVQQDFKTGQLTLPIVLLLETKPKNERLLFFKEICTLSIQELRSLILLNGIDKQLYDQAVFYENEAIKILLKLDKNKFSEALMNLIKFISLRIKK